MTNPLGLSDDEWFARAYPILLALTGLRAAVHRFEATMDGEGTELDARIAVGEALWWLSSLDEVEREALGFGSVKDWTEIRKGTASGKLIAGLVYARHKAGHVLAHVLGQTGSATADYEVVYPEGRSEQQSVTFRVTRQVIATGSRTAGSYSFPALNDPDAFGRDGLYERHVAHRDVSEVLSNAIEHFEEFSMNRLGVRNLAITAVTDGI